jgi:hypothetical protein
VEKVTHRVEASPVFLVVLPALSPYRGETFVPAGFGLRTQEVTQAAEVN